MTREEAMRYIEKMSYEEKYRLNELLKALAQNRQRAASLPESKRKGAK